MNALFDLYRRCFPCCTREDAAVQSLLGSATVIAKRDGAGRLIGASVIEGGNILLLCVDPSHRNRGVGSALLTESEEHIRANGFAAVTIGAGAHYIMPGIPSIQPMPGDHLESAALDPQLEDHTGFFIRRGYRHSWDCSCFDMRMNLADFCAEPAAGDMVYRFADPADLPAVLDCVASAHEPFVKYYRKPEHYLPGNPSRSLIALDGGIVAGALLVNLETEGPGLGSVGCTAVRQSHQGRSIATNLVILGTKHLKDSGMQQAFLGYTYSGLDKLYGRAGYRICCFYFMAEKSFNQGA